MINEEQKSKTMTQEQTCIFLKILNDCSVSEDADDLSAKFVINCMQSAYNLRQAEIDRLQAVISEQIAIIANQSQSILDGGENEAKRMIEFGRYVLKHANTWVIKGAPPSVIKRDILEIDIKSIYTNFKKG